MWLILEMSKAPLSCSPRCSFPTWDHFLSAGRSCSSSIHAPALPRRALLGTSPQASPTKFTAPSSPGSTLGCKSRSSSKLGDLLQDQSQRRRHRVWGADRGFPSPSPIPPRLASCEHSLQQLRQGGGSGKDAHKALRYPVFQAGKGAKRVCEGRRGAGPAQQLAIPPEWRSRGAQRESWRITRPAGLWEMTFGEAQSRQANTPKV